MSGSCGSEASPPQLLPPLLLLCLLLPALSLSLSLLLLLVQGPPLGPGGSGVAAGGAAAGPVAATGLLPLPSWLLLLRSFK
jgi:hypothetical protein